MEKQSKQELIAKINNLECRLATFEDAMQQLICVLTNNKAKHFNVNITIQNNNDGKNIFVGKCDGNIDITTYK